MKEILLIGGGGHCKSVIDVIEQEAKYKIVGIIDKKELIGESVLDYKIIGCDEDLKDLQTKYPHAIITVGHIKSNETRIKLFNLLKTLGFHMPSIISPLAYVSKHAFVDEGTIVMHHALLNPHAKIGKNCIINSKALIEHDVVVEENVHISTSAIINGGALIKANTFFGSGAIIKEYSTACGFIKAGSLVK
ncbi:MAG: acetyltransferase [Epsilonproteobacteria bacterium]|nr:acetyltransferase [Campylobacterota bacterium]OIO14228.1 MAG: acetyltransferase [Helicobacteraceae bacterium CG1_02_36_14]PIP09950.1 MAG: acetyltransferase [Sulfurimonas sp. CG23_combo_of_CG06-09_8_20_14_all_36_33]PIS26903.1 MAG: acetyltransferase [Sulfurimonas sp. CG08_land_8_20_14_0_20_36_33]PIU34718.1 MAG: acetyltransferase [Sulfurimonas sp. CG07_land_8_20_14_0_80_36_56]PIV03612.1 MAG: acetyltransferase [Sulfurimonas sp. CG03_land_8_20_14_0_80_36_25]PIV35839.1 MAG: acetyltransferase [Su